MEWKRYTLLHARTPILLIDMCMVNHASSATSHPHAHFLSGSGVESTICHTWLTLSASILFEMNEGKDEEERNTPGMYVFHVRPRPRVMDPRNVIQRASRSSHAAFRGRGRSSREGELTSTLHCHRGFPTFHDRLPRLAIPLQRFMILSPFLSSTFSKFSTEEASPSFSSMENGPCIFGNPEMAQLLSFCAFASRNANFTHHSKLQRNFNSALE